MSTTTIPESFRQFWAGVEIESVDGSVQPFGRVAALELDYFARGQFVHRLVGLVVSGDADGQRPAGDWLPWSDSEPPSYPASDDSTVARLLWQPAAEK